MSSNCLANSLGRFDCAVLWIALSSLHATGQAQEVAAAGTPIVLHEGKALTAVQTVDHEVDYVIEALAGQALLIQLDQDGLDFVVKLTDPAGEQREFNSPLFRDESDFVLIENSLAGQYHLTVVSEEPTNAIGRYTMTVAALDSSPGNAEYLEAWRLMSSGAAANYQSEGREAVSEYIAAARLWQSLGEPGLQAQSLYSAAMVYYWLLDGWIEAAELAASVAEAYGRLNEQQLYANAIYLRAYALIEVAANPDIEDGNAILAQALTLFRESYSIHERLGDLYDLALITNDMGVAYQEKGDFRQAEQYWEDAARLFAALDEWRWELVTRQNLALIKIDEGYSVEAVETLESILDQLPADKDPYLESVVLNNFGAANREAGYLDQALQSYSAAFDTASHIEERNQEAYALRGIGSTYFALGELELSEQYLRRALSLAEEIGHAPILAFSLAYLGNIAYLKSEFPEALELHRRAVEMTVSTPDRAYRQVFVAKDLVALGRLDEAVDIATEAMNAAASAGITVTQADAHLELGQAYLDGGRNSAAASSFNRALAIYNRLLLRGRQAEALHGLAMVARAQGNLEDAIAYGEDSLRRFESQRQTLIAPELRAFYSVARQSFYETQIDLLMAAYEDSGRAEPSRLEEALSASERARARLTVDLLTEASVHLRGGMASELLEQQDKLYAELSAYSFQRDRLLERENERSDANPALESIRNNMASAENELNLLETELRRSNRKYAALTNTEALSAGQIQAALGPDAVLLQYSLGEERSFAWIVTNDSLDSVDIAARTVVEAAARNAFDGLRTYDPSPARRRRLAAELQTLAEHVLWPLMPYIPPDKERLLVVADGVLQYVPLGVLPVAHDTGSVPLVQLRQITRLPSMTAWATQARAGRALSREPAIAIFADPVLEKTDPRLAASAPASGAKQTPVPDLMAANLLTRSSVGRSFGRLTATAAEAGAIAELLPRESRFVAAGFDASRETVLSMDLTRFNFLHFATHGAVDSRYPALSALVLSQYDSDGMPTEGFLRLHDIYNLELNADLVVLSACETALGREIRGEGLLGLTQGFLYAGTRNVVASLWQVPDRGTAELMTQFYRFIFNDGLAPASALRQAQLVMAEDRRWNDPYFWGGFVFLGGGP